MPFHFVQGALVAGLGQLLLWVAGIEVLDDLLISHQLIFSKSEEFIGLIEAQFPSVVLPQQLNEPFQRVLPACSRLSHCEIFPFPFCPHGFYLNQYTPQVRLSHLKRVTLEYPILNRAAHIPELERLGCTPPPPT